MLEAITRLRIELAEQLDTLPAALHSGFPDLAVDFLYTVFKEAANAPMPKLAASALDTEQAAAEARAAAAGVQAAPSADQMASSKALLESVEREAAEIHGAVAPKHSCFGPLVQRIAPHRGGASDPPASNSLVRCQRCRKVLFACATDEHILHCKVLPAVAQCDREPTPLSAEPNRPASKAAKRKRADSKSRLSKGSLHVAAPSNAFELGSAQDAALQPPLSPVLAAAAGLRQGRSAGVQRRRHYLSFVPGQDIEQPLLLNGASPAATLAAEPASAVAQQPASLPAPVQRFAVSAQDRERILAQYRFNMVQTLEGARGMLPAGVQLPGAQAARLPRTSPTRMQANRATPASQPVLGTPVGLPLGIQAPPPQPPGTGGASAAQLPMHTLTAAHQWMSQNSPLWERQAMMQHALPAVGPPGLPQMHLPMGLPSGAPVLQAHGPAFPAGLGLVHEAGAPNGALAAAAAVAGVPGHVVLGMPQSASMQQHYDAMMRTYAALQPVAKR